MSQQLPFNISNVNNSVSVETGLWTGVSQCHDIVIDSHTHNAMPMGIIKAIAVNKEKAAQLELTIIQCGR